ncbi:MAG: hypothetical protein QOK55_06600 [Nitrososphaeraceae archaeon]|nr:hypothetical protein [Nitrososphaeraceae archaeon]
MLEEHSNAYYNFINSLHSESMKQSYKFCLEKFLNHYGIDLLSFLKLPQSDVTNLIIKYLVDKKVSRQYKNLITATLKHACEINDVIVNWKKIKKFINSERTGNETNGRDRGYTHQEIQTILEFSEQRLKTAIFAIAIITIFIINLVVIISFCCSSSSCFDLYQVLYSFPSYLLQCLHQHMVNIIQRNSLPNNLFYPPPLFVLYR